MNHQQEIHQPNDTHFWEFYLSQYVVMLVICHDVASVGLDGTINKFVVIGVSSDEIKAKSRTNQHHIFAFQQGLDNSLCENWIKELDQNFFVLKENLIRYTQRVSSFQHRLPNTMVRAVVRNALYKTVSVKNYTHRILYLFSCLLLTEPLVQVHFVDFVKAFLVKFARFPHFLCQLIKTFSIIVADELFDVVQFLIALDTREKPQQIELSRIENRWLYIVHNNCILISNAAKISIKAETAKFYPIIFDKRPWFHHVTPSNYVVNPAGSPSARLAAYTSGASLKNEQDFKRKRTKTIIYGKGI